MPFLTPHSLVIKGERATQRLQEQSLRPALPRLQVWKAVLDLTSRLRSPLHFRPVVRLGGRRRSTSQTALGSHRPISHGVRRAVLLTRPPCPLPTCREGIAAAQSRRGHLGFPRHNHKLGQSQQHHLAARHVRAEKGRTAIPQCFSTAGRAHCPRKGGRADYTTAAARSPATVWPEGEVHRGRQRRGFPRKRARRSPGHFDVVGPVLSRTPTPQVG